MEASDQLIVVRRESEPRTYVYGIRFGQYVKIGVTVNPLQRLAALRLGSGVIEPPDLDRDDVEPLFVVSGDLSTERLLHTLYDPYRVAGEFFRLTPGMVDLLRRSCSDSVRERHFGDEIKRVANPVEF